MSTNSNKKKIVKFNGGLGNQMFQYAFALALGKKYSAEIFFDYSYFEEVKTVENVTTRFFELGVFNVDCKPASGNDLKDVVHPESKSKFGRTIKKIFPKLFGVNFVREKFTYKFDKNLFKNPDFKFYEGYFQNEKYFKSQRNELLKSFTLNVELDEKNQELLEKIKNTNSISLHIRRGDYVTLDYVNKMHGICSLDYYKNAIEYMASQVKNPTFYIFSDDIAWVLENLKSDYPYTVVDFNQGKGYLDMELMKNCKHNIIANSSFSWWGAWLNQNPEKIVIAPQRWTNVKQKMDVVPASWIKL